MVTRRTRNFKEKSTASNILGRLIMPVAVVMALALFYFSIKLFFFSPPREEQHPLPSTVNPPAVTEPYEGGDDYGDELPPIDDMDDTSTITPETPPAEQKPEPAETVKPAEKPKPAVTKPVQKPAEKPKPKPAVTQQPKPAQSSGPRWDVQIGGFRARSGAELTVKQAREKGYSAYVVDEKLDGQPFYKVRVRGHADKNEARALSQKLAAAGFPVYVVSVK
ncbi:SPOR domain-containing protein [uncultured Cloacibacillus sp.]|uniref:SPOR domain-containing protein n=1 Tax=uncultured Cloacibacillus sp. TaxID=889794 RepID=UPI0026DDC3D7|nr:SPOR domain-containing protein [uncultured Cloacibacillus sp.]